MNRTMFGTAVGLVLGLVLVFAGFGPMLVVALFGAAGWVVAKILAGELDLSSLTSITQQRRSPR
jgi:chromate transport protein ChrA